VCRGAAGSGESKPARAPTGSPEEEEDRGSTASGE